MDEGPRVILGESDSNRIVLTTTDSNSSWNRQLLGRDKRYASEDMTDRTGLPAMTSAFAPKTAAPLARVRLRSLRQS